MAKLAERTTVKEWFILIVLIILFTDLTIFLDIPFLRLVLGVIFLTILPGILILQILKLNKIELTEKFVLVVGLSISFLIFFGLLLNNLSLSFGYETPLSTIPLLISFNLAFIILAIIGYMINKEPIFSLPTFSLSTSEKAFLIVPILFPALSIFGMHVMNMTDNNIILMILLFLIPVYVVFVSLFNQKFPKRLYPVVIFLISISLLLMFALRSNHIIGVDEHLEYYFFQTILNNLHWSITGSNLLDACLSISLLPTIYQSILNTSEEYVFKIFYPLITSILPLIVYIVSKKYIGDIYAFLASFFLMSQYMFVFQGDGRTYIAILFFALAMMTLFSEGIDPLSKRIIFIIFVISTVVSHYTTTYIFFFMLLGSFLLLKVLSNRYNFKNISITFTTVALFFSILFFWYSQVTEAAFNTGVYFIRSTFISLNNFFIEESRSGPLQRIIGTDITRDVISFQIEFVLTWITFAFIAIGIIAMVKRYKGMVIIPGIQSSKPEFLKNRFEIEYFTIALVCCGLLVATVAAPFLSVGYDLNRTYNLVIVILSLFFVLGGIILSKHLKIHAYIIILIILIPYFLCVLGPMHNIFGYPRAITLNSEGQFYDMYYVHDQESYGAKWLKEYSDKSRIYTDNYGGIRLKSQGHISPNRVRSFIGRKDIDDGCIYLRYFGVVNGKVLGSGWITHNLTDYSDIFVDKSKVYNNGGSEVWE